MTVLHIEFVKVLSKVVLNNNFVFIIFYTFSFNISATVCTVKFINLGIFIVFHCCHAILFKFSWGFMHSIPGQPKHMLNMQLSFSRSQRILDIKVQKSVGNVFFSVAYKASRSNLIFSWYKLRHSFWGTSPLSLTSVGRKSQNFDKPTVTFRWFFWSKW